MIMCTTPVFKSELKNEFNNNLDKLNLLIIEAEKILNKKFKCKTKRK